MGATICPTTSPQNLCISATNKQCISATSKQCFSGMLGSLACGPHAVLRPGPCPQDSPAWHLLADTLGVPRDQGAAAALPLQPKPSLALPRKESSPVTAGYHSRGACGDAEIWKGHKPGLTQASLFRVVCS